MVNGTGTESDIFNSVHFRLSDFASNNFCIKIFQRPCRRVFHSFDDLHIYGYVSNKMK